MSVSPKTASVFFETSKCGVPRQGRIMTTSWDPTLRFPGDGYQDPQDGVPPETMDEDLDSGAARMTEESAGSVPSSAKKRRKSVPVLSKSLSGEGIEDNDYVFED
jgi:hypothetical protein